MPKQGVDFNIPLNLLLRDDLTKETLIAISYFRGQGKSFADPARDALSEYIRRFRDSLTDEEKREFNKILDNVKITSGLKRKIRDNS